MNWLSAELLAILPATASERTVPRGYYLVVAEPQESDDVRRYWDLIRSERINSEIEP